MDGPSVWRLAPGYPNPFNARTSIVFNLDRPGPVKLSVFNLLGEEVAVLVEENLDAGEYTLVWGAINKPSGVYLAVLRAQGETQTRKLTLLKYPSDISFIMADFVSSIDTEAENIYHFSVCDDVNLKRSCDSS